MKPRTKHVLRQAAICLPIALAAGWTIAGTIIPLMGEHFWTGAMYVMITAICFDIVLKMIYPKFAWTRPYEPPASDPNDPKRINFIDVGPKPGTTYPSEQELMKFCGPDENLRKMYLAEWRKINVRPWVDGIDDTWLTKTLAERQADNEEFRKLFFGDWVPKHPIHRYASSPRLEDLLVEIDKLGYGDEVFNELQNQPHLDPYLLTNILINFITMVKVNPNEKAIFKPFPETHA
ncbi:hypothetical protein D3C85_344040 [compost metagenome]